MFFCVCVPVCCVFTGKKTTLLIFFVNGALVYLLKMAAYSFLYYYLFFSFLFPIRPYDTIMKISSRHLQNITE